MRRALPDDRELSRSAAKVIPPLIVTHPNGKGVSAFPSTRRVGSKELLGGSVRLSPSGGQLRQGCPLWFVPGALDCHDVDPGGEGL